MDGDTGGWHLDRRVPVAIMLALVGQTILGGIWIGRMDARLEAVEAWQEQNSRIDSRLAVLEERVLDVNRRLDRQLQVLERLITTLQTEEPPHLVPR
jgi:hypothetical protein